MSLNLASSARVPGNPVRPPLHSALAHVRSSTLKGHRIRLKSPALLRLASALPRARRPSGEPGTVSAQRRGCLPAEGSGFGREPSAWLSDLEVIYTPPPSCSGIQTGKKNHKEE